jgi:hypothetical protein
LVFHTPFNPATVIALVTFVVGAGTGSMVYGVCHQQVRVKTTKRHGKQVGVALRQDDHISCF